MVHIQKKPKKGKQGLAQEDTASMYQDGHWASCFPVGKTSPRGKEGTESHTLKSILGHLALG